MLELESLADALLCVFFNPFVFVGCESKLIIQTLEESGEKSGFHAYKQHQKPKSPIAKES